MTPEEAKAARKQFDMTQSEFGKYIGFKGKHAGRTVRRIEAGPDEIDGTTAVAIEALIRLRDLDPEWRPSHIKDKGAGNGPGRA